MIPQGMQVFVALEPVDMRYSFDRLSGLAQQQVGYDARGGALFVFFGRRRDALKNFILRRQRDVPILQEAPGASLGCIVEAMAKEAKHSAFCLSTDATGVCIQPEPGPQRRACRKGHFFVVLADQDHVFFEFQPKHNSAAVCEMFRGFSGYIQADAHAVYDAVFRGEARACDDDPPPTEVGCRVGGGVAAPAPHR